MYPPGFGNMGMTEVLIALLGLLVLFFVLPVLLMAAMLAARVGFRAAANLGRKLCAGSRINTKRKR